MNNSRTDRSVTRARLLPATVSALCESLITEISDSDGVPDFRPTESFVTFQCKQMPDYLRTPVKLLTLLFAAETILFTRRRFDELPHSRRWKRVLAWKQSRFGFRRDLVRLYESLCVLGWYDLQSEA